MKRRRTDVLSFRNPSAAAAAAAAASSSASATASLVTLLLFVLSAATTNPLAVSAFETPSFQFGGRHDHHYRNAVRFGSRPPPAQSSYDHRRTAREMAFVAADDARAPSTTTDAKGASRRDPTSIGLPTSTSSASSSSNALPMELLVPQPSSSAGDVVSSFGVVMGAAMLVTSNTIGAGCLVLPELTAGPGLGMSAVVFGLSYIINLLSGLTLAHVAIEQHHQLQQADTATTSSPTVSSFQDLAKSTLGESAGTIVSSVSLLVNAAVLSFDVGQVGHITAASTAAAAPELVGPVASIGFAVAVSTLLANVPAPKLSGVASICVALLLASFGGLLAESAPQLLHDPIAPFVAPGTSPDTWGSLAGAAPVIFMSMVYQNIVPTIVKMLGYDATKTTAALSMGSLLPLGLYVLWCCAGGSGVDSSLTSNPLLAVFTLTTLLGSAIGTGLSLTEEVQSLRSTPALILEGRPESSPTAPVPQWTTVAASVGLPLVTALALGEGRIIEALEWAGSFGSPLLYGVLPAAMAFQRRSEQERQQVLPPAKTLMMTTARPTSSSPFVYSWQSAGALGLLSVGFIGQELVQQAAAAVVSS